MIKSIAAKVFSYLFNKYIDQIDSSQLELEIWNGKAKMENLRIAKNALAAHNLPFIVNNGSVGSISLVFPWGRLSTEPCIVNINDVYINASISSSVIIANDIETKKEVEKLHQQENYVSEGGSFTSIISQIIDNLQFHIKNVHLRIDLDDSIVAFGITISSINAFSVNEILEYAFITPNSPILRKKVEISDLTIYIEPNQEPVPNDNFSDHMKTLIYSTHHYILRPFNFSCHILLQRQISFDNSENNKENNENHIKIFANTQSLNLALDELQMRALLHLERRFAMFNTSRKYSHCGKPDEYPEEDDMCFKWWRYTHRCAIYKINKFSFNPKNALNILVNRKRYVELVEAGDEDKVKEFEKMFDLSVVLFLRNYSNAVKVDSKAGIKLLPEEIEAVIEVQKKSESQKIELFFKTGMLSISFLNKEMMPISRLLINEIDTNYYDNNDSNKFELFIKNLTMFNEMSKKFNKILTCNGETRVIINLNQDKPKLINVDTSEINFVLDLQFFNQIIEFFTNERKYIILNDNSDSYFKAPKQIQTLINQYKGIDLNINIANTSIVLPFERSEICPLLVLYIQKTSFVSKPNTNLNMNDLSTLYDKFMIKFENSMIYLDEKPLLFDLFNCNLDLTLAIVQSEMLDKIQVTCLLDKVHAHISTVQFLILENIILYIVDYIFYFLLDETEKRSLNYIIDESPKDKKIKKIKKNLELKEQLMKCHKNISRIRFTLKIEKIDFSLCLQTAKLFELLSINFELNCFISQFILLQFSVNNLTGYEFITSKENKLDFENNKFAYVELIKFDFTNKNTKNLSQKEFIDIMNISINNPIIYAKQKCLLYLIELLTDPNAFEKVFDKNSSFNYSKIQYKMIVPSYSFFEINLNLNNARGYLSNEQTNIGNINIKQVQIFANINTTNTVEISVDDFVLNNQNQLIEIMDKTVIKAGSDLVSIQRINPIIIILDFDYLIDVFNYVSNLTLPKEQRNKKVESFYSLKVMDFEIKSIVGSFNKLNFKINDFNLKGKTPLQLNFDLGLVDVSLNKISIVNIQNISVSTNNEIIDYSLINDLENLEKNKNSARELIELKQELSTDKFVIHESELNVKVKSIAFSVIPSILSVLPSEEKVSKFFVKNRNNSKEITDSKPKYETKTKMLFELNSFSFSFLEDKKTLLSLNLGRFQYKDHIIRLNSFSIVSDGKEPIAGCQEDFFCCSDSLKFVHIQDTDFILDYDLLLSLTKYLIQYSPILSYASLFQNRNSNKRVDKNNNYNKNEIDSNKEDDNELKKVDASLNKFSFYLKDKDTSICLAIAFNARENYFEINQLAISFIMGELTLPLLQPVSIKYNYGSKIKKLTVSPINFIIVIGVINFMLSLINKYIILFGDKNKAIKYQENTSQSDKRLSVASSIPENLEIAPININLGLCFNDRTPFVTFGFETSNILISQQISTKLQFSIVYFNPETGNDDLILEPLKIIADMSFSDDDTSINIRTSPIVLNIHIPFIKRLIYFNHHRKKQIKLDRLIYKFVNKMQTSISLQVGNIMHRNINPGESVPFNDVDLNTPITVEYDSVHFEKFVLSQLFYPTALSPTCFIYRENNRVMICSPIFIENSLDIPITVYSNELSRIYKINPSERTPLPTTIDVKQGLYFVYGELEIQNALASSSNKPVSRKTIINCSNETSLENLLASNAPTNSSKPTLYQLGKWTSSTPIIYKFLDNMQDEPNKDFVAFIYQKLEKEFIGIIEIAPILTIVNELPYDLKMYIKGFDSEFSIKSGYSIPFPFNSSNYNKSTIECQFESAMHGDSAQTTISYKDNSKTEIIFKDSVNKKTLSFTAHAVETSNQIKLYIYSPAIICNRCGFLLNYRNISDLKPLVLYNYALLGSQTFVQNSTLNIQIQCDQFHSDWQKEKIDCTAVGIESTIFLPTSNESIFVPIHINNHKATSPFIHTTIIDFSPALVLINETIHHFILNPSTEDAQFWLKVYPHSKIRIVYSTKNSQFFVQLRGIEKSIKIILASPTKQVFRFNDIYIEMETILISGTLCCYFKDARMPSPIVFTNLLSNSFNIYQNDSENPIVVEPNSTSLFAYDDPFGENSVIIDFGINKIKVPLNSNCEPTKIEENGFFIEIKTAGKDHRMLIISETSIAVSYDTSFHFSLSVEDILVSLINQNMTELCLISFHNLYFKTSNEGPNSLYELLLDSFQIDDQLNIAPFSTFLIGNSNEKSKFLHLSAICYRDSLLFSSFKNFTFSMQKLFIYADMSFISDMFGFVKEIQKAVDKVKEKKIKLDNGSDYCQVKSTLLLIENDSENEIIKEKRYDKLISFSSLTLHPFLATVTFRGLSGRPSIMPRQEQLQSLLIIPNITNATLTLKSFQVENFLTSISMLNSNILEGYKNQLIMESWRIAGHSDIFFNVFGIAETFGNGFKSMFYDPIKADVESPEKLLLIIKGGGQLIIGTLGSIIQGGEGFIKNVSNFLSMIDDEDSNVTPTDNTNLNAVDTFTEGISSLGNGLVEGISGLIKKPIEGGKKDGVLGVVTGLAKGAIGAVTKPTAGLLDMSAGIIGGIRKTITLNDGTVVKRFREPNSYPFSIVGGFDIEMSKMQAYAQKLNKKKMFYLMKLMAINIDNEFAYALFDKRLFFFKNTQSGFEFYSKLNIAKIQNISREEKTVKFQILGKNKIIQFSCMTQEMAEKFVIVLNSLVTFASIFN